MNALDVVDKAGVWEFYTDVVLPALADRLDVAFPEFGWRRDARGWVASNEEMTHRVLGVRADRVIAHGPAPCGFLVHGGEATLWTAYLNGGITPRGADFVRTVEELAARASVDASAIERSSPRNRGTDLLHDFFTLCRWELVSERGEAARSYLEQRGIAPEHIATSGLGAIPHPQETRQLLQTGGYSTAEIEGAGVVSDARWTGRLCGAWRDERGSIRTIWARLLEPEASSSKYLYLKGASRTGLVPYGTYEILKSHPRQGEIVVVEGLLDVHHLRTRGVGGVVALGGTATRPELFERLARLGIETATLCLDRDAAGRMATAKAIENAGRGRSCPALFVVDPDALAPAKDPDDAVRERGAEGFVRLLGARQCAVTWRSLEFARDLPSEAGAMERKAALARAGSWLGSLPPRLALEQEDAVRAVAARCGYSRDAVARAFRARYWDDSRRGPASTVDRGL